MSKPLIAVDLDGTLIDGQGHYSLATRDYFRDLSAQGCIIVLASGRPFRAMKHIYEDLRLTGPSICYNGQLVFDPNDPSFHPVDKRFKAEDIRRVYNDLKPCVEVFMAESANTIYITDEDARLSHFFPSEGMNIV